MYNKNHSGGSTTLLPCLSSLQSFYTKAGLLFFLSKQAKKTTYVVQKKEGETLMHYFKNLPIPGPKRNTPILLQI